MDFEFATATRILFGRGRLRDLGGIGNKLGRRALVVTGRTAGRARQIAEVLSGAGIPSALFHVTGEPTIGDIIQGTQLAKNEGCDFVIGVGGGSALDSAKAIAALLTNPGDLLDYLEVIGSGQPLTKAPAACVTIPTTAGTGAEVTRNSVLSSPEHRFKVSLRSPLMLPRLALIDPQLTEDLPPHLTATTGLDALTQLIEPCVSHRANPLTDSFCMEGLRRVARSLHRAYVNGHDSRAREDMALASLLSGLALANAALGAVHGFAAPLGGMYSAPHGAICAALLPHVMEVNISALGQRHPDGEGLQRYAKVAQVLTGDRSAPPTDGVLWVRNLCSTLHIQPLKTLGVRSQDFPLLVEKAAKASSMKGNPLVLTLEEMREILGRAFGG